MARLGISLVDVPEGTVIHRGSGSSGNGSLFYEYHMCRAHILLTGKLGHAWPVRMLLLVGRAVTLTLRAAVRSVRYRSLRPWRGLAMAVWDVTRGRLRTLTPPAAPEVARLTTSLRAPDQ
jgi:GT2 family glycosyltransferase